MNILYLQISICLEKKYIFSVHLPTYYDLFLFVCLFVLFLPIPILGEFHLLLFLTEHSNILF